MKDPEIFPRADQLLPHPLTLTDGYRELDARCDFASCSAQAVRQCPVCGKFTCREHDGHDQFGTRSSDHCVCKCSGGLIWGTVWGCSVDTIGKPIVDLLRDLSGFTLKATVSPGKDYFLILREREAEPVTLLFIVHGNRFKADVRSWVSSAPPARFAELRDRLVPAVEMIMKTNGIRRSYRIDKSENRI